MADKPTAARVLSTRLAGVLHGYLAGRLTAAQVAEDLRKIATWVERGAKRKEGKKDNVKKEDVDYLFAYWVRATGRDTKKVKLTPNRQTKLSARLRDGYSLQDIQRAIDAVASSPFHQGENERGHRYDDLILICRSGDQVEKYRDMAPRSVRDPTPQDDEATLLRARAREALSQGDTDAYNEANRRLAELSRNKSA